jgi:hypothetical protein
VLAFSACFSGPVLNGLSEEMSKMGHSCKG